MSALLAVGVGGVTAAAGVAGTSSSALTDAISRFPIKLKARKLDTRILEHFFEKDIASEEGACDFIAKTLLPDIPFEILWTFEFDVTKEDVWATLARTKTIAAEEIAGIVRRRALSRRYTSFLQCSDNLPCLFNLCKPQCNQNGHSCALWSD